MRMAASASARFCLVSHAAHITLSIVRLSCKIKSFIKSSTLHQCAILQLERVYICTVSFDLELLCGRCSSSPAAAAVAVAPPS